MTIVPPSIPVFFDVTFDSPSLFVAMSVYDITASPTLVAGPTAMVSVVGNTYVKSFTAIAAKSYLIFKAVYTDGTFTTLSPDYSQGTETILCENQNTGSVVTNYIGMNTVIAIEDVTNTVLTNEDLTNNVLVNEDVTNNVLIVEAC